MNQKEVEELTQRFQAGDDDAGWKLVLSQKHLLMGLIRDLSLDSAIDEEDVLSEMQISTFEALKFYKPGAGLTLSGYVKLKFFSRYGRILTRLAGIDSVPLTDVCVYPDTQDQSDDRELLSIISDALDRIQPLHKEVFVMWCQDASLQQIANAANKTLGVETYNELKAQKLINDSLAVLRKVLDREIENLS